MYDFETLVKRTAQGSSKWLAMKQVKPNVAEDIAPLSVADADIKLAPEIVTGLQAYLQTMVLGYTNPTPSYYAAVVDWYKRRHHYLIEPEWIVPSAGVIKAIHDLINTFTSEGDGIIIMPPVYHVFSRVIKATKREVVNNPLIYQDNYYTIDFSDLEKQLSNPKNKILLFCSPHNPIGRVWQKAELLKVSELCNKHQVLVIADEIHHDLIMPGYQHHIFTSINEAAAQNTILTVATSKSFNLAGLKTSNIVIPNPTLRTQYLAFLATANSSSVNVLGLKATELAYNEAETWFEGFLALIEHNRKWLTEYLNANVPQVTVVRMEGTYLQWLDLTKLNLSCDELLAFLQDQCDFFPDAGQKFGLAGAGFMRVNLATPTWVLKAALERLAQGIKQL